MPRPGRRASTVLALALGTGGLIVATRARRAAQLAPTPLAAHRSGASAGPEIADGRGLAVLVNPAAGSGSGADALDDVRAALPRAHVIEIDGQPIDAAFAQAKHATVLGIAGGDGSINAAAGEALATGRPLAVFPAGTLNHFARDLGIEEPADTIAALRAGSVVEVDVGTIAGRPFLNTASFGSYAEFVDAREQLEERIGKWPAAMVAAAKVLRHSEPLPVELDGRRATVWMIFIGNCEYHPPGSAPSSRSCLDDRRFDVRYLDGRARFSRLRFLGALALGRLAGARVFTRLVVESLDVHSLDGPLRLACDGETFDGGVDVRITKHPDRLAVYAG